MPAKRPSTRKAGTGRPAARTTSRAWTSSVIGALRSVAGSKTETSMRLAGLEARGGEAARRGSATSAGGSASSRVSRALARRRA